MTVTPRIVLCIALLTAVPALCLAAQAPVVVLLDSSRSLRPPEFAAVAGRLGETLRALPADVPTGLMEFNDAPVWVVPMGAPPSTVAEALRAVSPAGKRTLLLDAIATAVRELPSGGVVLLATDGRDEGSVATVADVGALCTVRHVRVMTLAMGPRPETRTLQRLALLTGGAHLGQAESADAATIGGAIAQARREILAAMPTPVPAPQPVAQPVATAVPVAPSAPSAPAGEEAATGGPNLALLLAGVVVVAAALVALVVWRSKKGGKGRVCPDCGQPMETWEANCSNCAIERLQLRKVESEAGVAPPAEALHPEVEIFDASEFAKLPTEERLEKTFSLDEHAVLIVRQQRRPVRTFALDPTKVIHAGRSGTVNTVAIDDPSVSGQHFKIVPKDGEFYILDLDSTNGTYVNGERIKFRKLKSGDTVMAGQVECEFRKQFVRRA